MRLSTFAIAMLVAPTLAAAQTAQPMQAITVYGGLKTINEFTPHFYKPWDVVIGDDYLVALAYSNRVASFWRDRLHVEVELLGARRFGRFDSMWEIGAGLMLRWTAFPWNHHVKTSVGAVVLGPSWTTEGVFAEALTDDGRPQQFQNYFSPELTFADPDNPDWEMLVRIHHRSGAFGLINGVVGGSNILAIGLRYRF